MLKARIKMSFKPGYLKCWTTSLIIALAPIMACSSAEAPATNGVDREQKDSTKAVPVETHVLSTGTIFDKVFATGTIFPKHDALISSQTSGTIIGAFADVGDYVAWGERLIQVDDELKKLALEQTEAKLIEAKAVFEKATTDLERNKKLFEAQDISEHIYDTAKLQKKSAEALYLGARAQVKIAKRQLQDAQILSPVNGIVAEFPLQIGHSVAPGTPVARIINIDSVKCKFGVAEKDVVKISVGQRAQLRVDAYPELAFEGSVTVIGPQADLTTRTFPVEVSVQNPSFRLRGGMIAKVEVLTATSPNVILMPKSAILERSGNSLIFVVHNKIAQQREPIFGPEAGQEIVLLEGGSPGEEVVISGQENLVNGVSVEVKRKHN